MGKLTKNQKIFCDEYLIDLNATRAYKVAYKNVTKDETAAASSSRLLRNVKVKDYVNERMKAREKRTEVTQDKVLKELAKIGFANITDYINIIETEGYNESGELQKYNDVKLEITKELDEAKQSAISEIKRGKNGVELKLNDKVKALELIGKHLGMFVDRVEQTGDIGLTIEWTDEDET